MSEIALQHIEHLSSTIGPRGSTTPAEKAGHDYTHGVLSGLGCQPRSEAFFAPTSTYSPFILGLSLALAAEAIFWLTGRTPNAGAGALAAAAFGLIALTSLLLELLPAENPLRWFVPGAPSRNVIGVTPAAGGQARRRVALLAHVDTHRTPWFWRTPGNFKIYRAITTLGFAGLAALNFIFVIGVFAPGEALVTASLVPVIFVALALAMVVEAHFSRFTAGANDNASGVGVMLALAGRLKAAPLANTEVWWVATGCEEMAGAYGSRDFVRRHAEKFKDGWVIVVDNVAGQGTGLNYLTSESILTTHRYPAAALALAEQVAAAQPGLGARPHKQTGAFTDAVHPLKAGLPVVSLLSFTPAGWLPDWHNLSDVFANVDAAAVDRAEQFAWHLLQAIDGA